MSSRSVVLATADRAQLREVAAGLGLHLVDVPGGRGVSRPAVLVDSGDISVSMLGCTADAEPLEVRMIAGSGGLVALVPDPLLEDVRRTVAATPDPMIALVEVLIQLAMTWDRALEDLVELAEDLGGSVSGLRSSEPRGRIARLRTRLFATRHRMSAQARLLDPGGELSGALPAAVRPRLARARTAFEFAASTADQTYQLLGEVLSQQATTVSERLTLISVIFLPLTVITGFFGMNFGWLVDHTTTPASFWLLGVVIPCAVVAGILWMVRTIDTADGGDSDGRPARR